MEKFPHLQFQQKITGSPRFHGGGGENPRTLQNKQDRQGHSVSLGNSTTKIKSDWEGSVKLRGEQGLAEIDGSTAPVFFQINPDIINTQFDLEAFGIEIISEEEDGYILGASFDNLKTLEEKISGFITSKHGTSKIADFWQIIDGDREEWKPRHILSENLYSRWAEIVDDEIYRVEVSVAFAKPIGEVPDPEKKGGEARLRRYREQQEIRDNLLLERQDHFEEFISYYGSILSSIVELEDSFSCEVEICGLGLKDLVVNYQFVFEVSEIDEISGINGAENYMGDIELEIIPPDANSIEVGVIDSGIMENHKYIEAAIKRGNSKSYMDDSSTADHVAGGGHGTKVAGAILYPNGISEVESPYKLPCFIRNLRILDEHNRLLNLYPAGLIKKIVEDNEECEIYNLSVNSNTPYRTKHMSTWAAIIDRLSFEKDILFLISTGNISFQVIRDFISRGTNYPDYLEERFCKLANPSQSCFSLSVGSINHSYFEDDYWHSIGGENGISAFSRIGTGIWDTIKPDVVEYGGGVIMSKNGIPQIREHETTSPELIRSTLHGGSAIGKDSVGTSFSTPKVAYLAAILKQLYPDENINLIRAFIAQGARLPDDFFLNPTKTSVQYFGYGLPILDRVIKNTDHRVTFYNTGKIKAEEGHIYSLKIPEELRSPGDEYDIVIEVTLAYSAQVRRTRQKTKSYLSTWLDWTTSKIGESFDEFKDYALRLPDEEGPNYDSIYRNGLSGFNWKIRNRSDYGDVLDINRNNSSLQKDWTVLKSFELPEEISFAVRGHKGWDKNKMEVPFALTVSIEILGADIPIYESIRIENEIELEV
ncbi:MAG: S8 family peptidase [Candidatus Woesearchaeota archaeon]|nr:S8 family peptidase [Candidatus Woesearchaeota archaeon]